MTHNVDLTIPTAAVAVPSMRCRTRKLSDSTVLNIILCVMVAFMGASCSRKSLNRASASELILRYEQLNDKDCNLGFLIQSADQRTRASTPVRGLIENEVDFGPRLSDLRTELGPRVGKSMCTYSVDVTGISLTSENIRDVVFVETRAPDHPKWRVVSAYVDALFARLSILPVQTVRVRTTYLGYDYVLAVIDPKDGRKYYVEDVFGPLLTERESLRLAKTKKLGIHGVSRSLPFALSGLNGASNPGVCLPMQKRGVAKLQMFDDGWRVIEIKGEFEVQGGDASCLEGPAR